MWGLRRVLGRISRRSWKGLGALVAPFALGLVVLVLTGASNEVTPERIQAGVLSLGPPGLLAFVAAAAIRPLSVVVSGSLFAVAAGLIWGPWLGAAIALGGAAFASLLVFALARSFGTGAVRDLAGPRWDRFSALARTRGFAFVLVATLGFQVPTDVVIAVSAASGMRARAVVAATTLGSVPGTLAMATLGATAARPSRPLIALAIVAIVLLTVLGTWLAKRLAVAPIPVRPQAGPGA
jgi:uncharacterized membrane protein YdjX (TVP38/TMEM64 family)